MAYICIFFINAKNAFCSTNYAAKNSFTLQLIIYRIFNTKHIFLKVAMMASWYY